MFLWTKPLGLKTFRNSPEKAADSAVLAANQGLYNGFLAAGLVWGLLQGTPGFGFQIKTFFLLCVVVDILLWLPYLRSFSHPALSCIAPSFPPQFR